MKRYFWERGENSATKFLVFDGIAGRLPGTHIAVCRSSVVAQKIVDALNAREPAQAQQWPQTPPRWSRPLNWNHTFGEGEV